jgi:hypothetical protein
MAANQIGDGSADGVQLPNTKAGFFGVTPVAQPTNPGNTHTTAAGATTAVFTNTAFDGGVGSKGYTVGDIVQALKNLGLIAS